MKVCDFGVVWVFQRMSASNAQLKKKTELMSQEISSYKSRIMSMASNSTGKQLILSHKLYFLLWHASNFVCISQQEWQVQGVACQVWRRLMSHFIRKGASY
jgi:hypothetical protein